MKCNIIDVNLDNYWYGLGKQHCFGPRQVVLVSKMFKLLSWVNVVEEVILVAMIYR